ncbi:hypothetical protein PC110_g2565 [Phytophthora cactorum]|uniref:Uncharacterized protein n=1 Tax=Phytophthora cactorum TaxID=29920 RepID=A0A329SZ47_9STRA|nr:hypothetical protein PC110_g2565 [Phytophthora cactorum]
MAVEKAHRPLQPTYVPEARKEEEGWRPGRDFFVGEEELMKYLDHVDLEMLHSSHQEATQATATQERSQASGQSRREAAATERGSGEGKDDAGASIELGGEVSPPQTRRNITADFGEATSSDVPDTLTAHKSIQSATTSKDAILEDTCNDKEAPCATTETVSGLDTYAILVLEGEDDVGAEWDSEDLTGEGKPYFGVDEDGPPKPALLFEDELIKAVGGVGTISSGTVPTGLLREMGNRLVAIDKTDTVRVPPAAL